ncbi:MAG: MFS transporter [Candidatus Heimdallarchaeota archaeon]|nr:MFS transporter [Candidatus Heimdallarchaeota archaeon]
MSSSSKSFNIRTSFPKWAPLISTLLLAGITYGVQRTSLALYAKDLSGTDITEVLVFLQVASTIIAYGLFKGIAGFFSSRLSAKFKRKNTMRIGLSLLFLGSISIVLAEYIQLAGLIIGNVFIGAGLGLFFTSSMSALTEIAGSEGSAFSVGTMEFSVYLGSSVGAFFAGLIQNLQSDEFTASFIFALVVAGVAVILGIILLRKVETKELVKGTKEEILLDSTKVETKWRMRNILKTPTLLLSYLAGHFSRIMDSLIVLLLPILVSIEGYDFTLTEIGLVTSGFTLAWALSMPITGRISDRFGRKEAIIIGLLIEGVAIIVLTFTYNHVYIILLAILAGIGTAIYYPSLPSITRDVVPIVKREQSLGLYRASLDSGYFTGPLIAMGLTFSATKLNIWNNPEITDPIKIQLENQLKFPFLIIGIILGVIALSFLFLATETRPGWVQASISLKHSKKVRDFYSEIKKAFSSYIEGKDIDYCSEAIEDAKNIEREADDLVMKVTQALYGKIRPAPDDYHFYKIVDILDSSIGFTLRSIRKLILIPREKLPDSFIKYLRKEKKLLLEMISRTVDALEVVCIQPLASHPIFEDVHRLENKLDTNSQKGLAIATKDLGKLNAVESMYIIQIIEALEISANLIEDAVDVMKIIGLKYQVRPLKL